MVNKPGKPPANSAAGNALATTLMPGSAALAAAMRGKKPAPSQPSGDPTMHELANTLHPVPDSSPAPTVNMTPNRVTGRFSNE